MIFNSEKAIKTGHPMTMIGEPVIVWNKHVPDTEMDRFRNFIQDKYNKTFGK